MFQFFHVLVGSIISLQGSQEIDKLDEHAHAQTSNINERGVHVHATIHAHWHIPEHLSHSQFNVKGSKYSCSSLSLTNEISQNLRDTGLVQLILVKNWTWNNNEKLNIQGKTQSKQEQAKFN